MLSLLLGLVLVAYGGFVVCGKCGYENSDQSSVCRHCDARLAAKTGSPEEGTGSESTGTSDAETAGGETEEATLLPEKVVLDELKEAQQAFSSGNVEMARLLARNASALELLSAGKHASQIEALLSRCDAFGKRVTRKCADCNGSGKASMTVRHLQGEDEILEKTGITCQACRGRGYVVGDDTIADRKFRIGRALNDFVRRQQSKKFVPIGGAWVPASIEGELALLQTVQLKRMTAAPCSDCLGIGRESCESCKGLGYVECSEKGCENGRVTIERKGELVRWSMRQQRICSKCKGRGREACKDCMSRGSVLCESCNGLGQRSQCSRCSGQGMSSCRRCGGTGNYRDEACRSCGGVGRTVCTSCNGDGRKK